MAESYSGGCLCGKVRYRCDAAPMFPGHCHCSKCQKLTGSGHASMFAVPKAALALQGELNFHQYVADSGNTVLRGFCPACGSPVYNENKGVPEMGFLYASSLDEPALFKPELIVYTAKAQAWDCVDPGLPSFPGELPNMAAVDD